MLYKYNMFKNIIILMLLLLVIPSDYVYAIDATIAYKCIMDSGEGYSVFYIDEAGKKAYFKNIVNQNVAFEKFSSTNNTYILESYILDDNTNVKKYTIDKKSGLLKVTRNRFPNRFETGKCRKLNQL